MALQPNLRLLQEVQSRVQLLQAQLGEAVVTGSAGGGAVTCQMSGLQELKSITIQPGLVDLADLSPLEELIVLAINEGLARARQLSSRRTSALAGAIRPPGLM